MTDGALLGIRVLDLTSYGGEIAGRMLADLGAEVIKVEDPAGTASRHRGAHDPSVGSFFWAAYGRGKRSVVLDRTTADGKRRFEELLARTDIVFASEPAGEFLDRHPGVIWVVITAFGSTGPSAGRAATDLTIEAAGGLLALQGDADRPPVPVGYPQSFLHAGAQAAADALIALRVRDRTGLGQELDVSAQAAMVWTLMNAFGWAMLLGSNVPGTCELRDEQLELVPGIEPPMPRVPVWPTSDGHAVVTLQLPLIGERTLQKMIDWATSESALSADLAERSWLTWRADLRAGDLARSAADRIMAELEAFVASKTNAQVHEFAVREGVTVAAVHTLQAVLDDAQLEARSFWATCDQTGLRHPYEWAKFSRTPISAPRRAPTIGDDDVLVDRILEEPARPRVAAARAAAGTSRPFALADIKVADFSWVGAAPLITRALADHGADVVRIETETRPDVLRKLPPMADGTPGLNRSQFFAMMNTSKRSVAIDLSSPDGLEVARELIDWADVVVDSFTPGTMDRLGLGYSSLSAKRPELVMLSSCLRGQFGPERSFAGFGNQGAALAGLLAVTGWPDRAPCGPWGAYTDFITPRFGVAALLAALHHRDQTGQGQFIDLAQVEAGIQFIEPKLLEAQRGDVSSAPVGYASDDACPHGVFETADERHMAIAVETASQWRSLVEVASLDRFRSEGFDELSRRIEHKADVEADLASWCAARTSDEVDDALAAAGVPVHVVAYPSELVADAQLDHREFFSIVDHPEIGPAPMEGHVTRFSATPPRIRRPAPLLGEHTDEVLDAILGHSPDRIAALRAADVLT